MSKFGTLICGPCSAETEEQVFATAKALCEIIQPKPIFRAGLWKPRTHPDSFEGVGEIGIPWLVSVQKQLGLKVIVEVANPTHLEAVLKAGLDMVWIGSRTTTNSFAMQDLCDALRGVDIPVFVKNPINPDIELWIGAIERLQHVGIKRITAIHRGFSYYEKSKYRNMPKWQVPIDLMQRMPSVPVICDPSHIAGDRAYVAEISQKAMDLGFKGLFVESHIAPSEALSDAQQQLTPTQLASMLDSLTLRSPNSDSPDFLTAVEQLRANIDVIDDNILELLDNRMKLVDEIGRFKKDNNITVLQPHRWEAVLKKAVEGARERGLEEKFVEELFKLIHQASIERQS